MCLFVYMYIYMHIFTCLHLHMGWNDLHVLAGKNQPQHPEINNQPPLDGLLSHPCEKNVSQWDDSFPISIAKIQQFQTSSKSAKTS